VQQFKSKKKIKKTCYRLRPEKKKKEKKKKRPPASSHQRNLVRQKGERKRPSMYSDEKGKKKGRGVYNLRKIWKGPLLTPDGKLGKRKAEKLFSSCRWGGGKKEKKKKKELFPLRKRRIAHPNI